MSAVSQPLPSTSKLPSDTPDEGENVSATEAAFLRLRESVAGYLRNEDVESVEKAFQVSAQAHEGQYRISGEPYVSHPLAVAEILAQWHLDAQALIGALLHDVMEDTTITKQDIAEQFGKTAADLVDGVSKLDRIEFRSYEEAQAENFRKMLLAMARDVRVILIKLADRLHNMRTLDCVRADKRRRIARETLEIYAPIANRLGLNSIYRELQELAFSHLHPMRYRVLAKAIRAARGNRRELVGKLLTTVQERLPAWNISAEVFGREKHVFGVYRKMLEKRLSFSQVLDIYGFRVIVKDIPTCYLALGVLHELFKPVPGKFKDYIAIPKANGYQSLHTTVIGPYGGPVEIQIRTNEMQIVAQSGVASHWLYKDDSQSLSELQRKTHHWLQSLLELQTTSDNSAEFLEHVKIDLFPGEVFVFTPKGKILSLPRGATAVDFAYAVHTDIGNRCVACKINNEILPLRTELRNGDQVEIVTAVHAHPNPTWLTYVRTGKARAQIRHFLKTTQQEEASSLGERLLSQALRAEGVTHAQITAQIWDRFLRDCGLKSFQDIYTEIGLGKRLASVVARRLAEMRAAQESSALEGEVLKAKQSGPILIRGSEGVAVQFARCCHPIPGDPIVGLIRKDQGLEVHLNDCTNLTRNRSDRERWVDVEWEPEIHRLFAVNIRVLTQNQRGVLAKLASIISAQDANIQNVSMDGERGDHTSIYFTLQVYDRLHLARTLRALRRFPEVMRIARIKGDMRHH